MKTATKGRFYGNKWICRLKTLALHGVDLEIGDYAKEMYNFYSFSNELCHKIRYYVHMIMKNMIDIGLN